MMTYGYQPAWPGGPPVGQPIPQYQQLQQTQLPRVTGVEGARAYQMAPNSSVALFDADNDLFYVKSTDAAGFPTIRSFAFTEVGQSQPHDGYVTREEFERLREEVRHYAEQPVSVDAEVIDQPARRACRS